MPTDNYSFVSEVTDLINSEFFTIATVRVQKRLDSNPFDEQALSLMGKIKLRQGHPRQAAKLLEEALSYSRCIRISPDQTPRSNNSGLDDGVTVSDIDHHAEAVGNVEDLQLDFDLDIPFDESVETDVTLPRKQKRLALNSHKKTHPSHRTNKSDFDDLEAEGKTYFQIIDYSRIPLAHLDIALEDLTDYLLDIEEQPMASQSRKVTVEAGQSRRYKAQQEANTLGTKYGWTSDEIVVLARVFEKHGWFNVQHIMQRELNSGLTACELGLADQLRDIWLSCPEFSLSVTRYAYPVMSWSLALKLLRSFPSLPDIEEVEYVLHEMHDTWRHTPSYMQDHPSFYMYLRRAVSFPSQIMSVSPAVNLSSCDAYSLSVRNDDTYQQEVGFNSPTHDELTDFGLIPDYRLDIGYEPEILDAES